MRSRRPRWSDLSSGPRWAIVGAATLQVTLHVAALTDMRRRAPEEINGDRRMWGAVSLVNVVGPLAYFAFGRKR